MYFALSIIDDDNEVPVKVECSVDEEIDKDFSVDEDVDEGMNE